MIITASGGTDAANMVLFWPDNLPDNGDQILRDDPINLIESLREEGKLIWFLCESDGGYSMSVYWKTPIPAELLKFCTDKEYYPNVVVSGDGYFGGMEYIFKTDRSFLDRYPHMCEKVAIPNGSFSAKVYCTDVPESVYNEWITGSVGLAAKRIWDLQGGIFALSFASILISMVSFFVVPWIAWFGVVGVTVVLCLLAIGLSKTNSYQAMANANKEYERAFPAYVVQLQ